METKKLWIVFGTDYLCNFSLFEFFDYTELAFGEAPPWLQPRDQTRTILQLNTPPAASPIGTWNFTIIELFPRVSSGGIL